jgi:hypothetical protein
VAFEHRADGHRGAQRSRRAGFFSARGTGGLSFFIAARTLSTLTLDGHFARGPRPDRLVVTCFI